MKLSPSGCEEPNGVAQNNSHRPPRRPDKARGFKRHGTVTPNSRRRDRRHPATAWDRDSLTRVTASLTKTNSFDPRRAPTLGSTRDSTLPDPMARTDAKDRTLLHPKLSYFCSRRAPTLRLVSKTKNFLVRSSARTDAGIIKFCLNPIPALKNTSATQRRHG